jgi:hypothetical protein
VGVKRVHFKSKRTTNGVEENNARRHDADELSKFLERPNFSAFWNQLKLASSLKKSSKRKRRPPSPSPTRQQPPPPPLHAEFVQKLQDLQDLYRSSETEIVELKSLLESLSGTVPEGQ